MLVALQSPPRRADGARARRAAPLAYAVAPAALLLLFEPAGWPLTAVVVGGALLLVSGARPLAAALAAVAFAGVTWVLFAMLLRVPLPRGPLDFLPY